jgi:hypothetical protein
MRMEIDSAGFMYDNMAGFHEYGNECLDFIKLMSFLTGQKTL